ncbi:MAG: HIT family protein [Bacteroidia bacterium]|nr:HIT family protein [Bacteroidia bacterium]
MSTIFSKIVSGEIPCHKIYEDEHHLAFLDIMPLVLGHVLCIPKKEVDYIYDLSPSELSALWAFTQPVANAVKQAISCKRVGVAVIGLEVPHAHVHLMPLNEVEDINFTRPKLKPTTEELSQIAEDIRRFL